MFFLAKRFLVIILITVLVSACAAPGPDSPRHTLSKKWANCSFTGGTIAGAGGIIQGAAIAGAGFATGAVVAGASCVIAKYYRGEKPVSTVSWEEEPDDDDDWFPETRTAHVPKLTIRFSFDSYELSKYERAKLFEIADNLSKNGKIIISGYTCNMGVPIYNVHLSEMRAKSVRSYLVEYGVKPWKIRYEGRGSDNPIADNTTLAGRKSNRRVEVDTQY